MAAAGVFKARDRVELIEGEVIQMTPIGIWHASRVLRLADILRRLGERALLSVQSPIRLGSFSEPEPDLALLRRRDDYFAGGLPEAHDVLLIVEVADTSAQYDRGTKLSLYARHGIPEIWILDLSGGLLEVNSQPAGDRYAATRQLRAGNRVAPLAFPDFEIEVGPLVG